MRRLETAREQFDRRQHLAMPTDPPSKPVWYHTSDHELPVGTKLTPGGGTSLYQDWYEEEGLGDRQQHVWVEPSLQSITDLWAGPNSHVYEVEPDDDPFDAGEGWTTSGATITKALGRGKDLGVKMAKSGSLNEYLYRYAMPREDYYDLVTHEEGYAKEKPGVGEIDQTPVRPGPWYHSSPRQLDPGTVLDPTQNNNYSYWSEELQPRDRAVFMHHDPDMTEQYGEHLYEVKPMGEGPYAYNGEDHAQWDGYASPKARVIRKIVRPGQEPEVKDFADAMSRMAAVPGEIHRGLTLDMDAVSPQMRQILNDYGPESPEFIQELLRHGTGTYWSRDRGFAEGVNPGNGLQVALSADWDGNGAQGLHPENTRKLPDSWGDMSLLAPQENAVSEFNLKPGKELNVKSIRVRKKGDPGWREVLRQPQRARTGSLHVAMPYYHNTYSDFSPGDEIIPWAERNMGYDAPGRSEATGYDPNSVYLSDETAKPEHFDWYGPNRYEVEPIGDVSLDPEYEGSPDLGASFKAPRARVIRRHALNATDAYDTNRRDPRGPDQTPALPGPWYHSTDVRLKPGDILDADHSPNFDYDFEVEPGGKRFNPTWGPRDNWVFVDPDLEQSREWGRHTYEVEPLEQGPYDYNGPDEDAVDRIDGFVTPRARIVRQVDPDKALEDMWSKALKGAGLQYLAMPMRDAWDAEYKREDWPSDYKTDSERDVVPEGMHQGPWWHATTEDYGDGDIIMPNKGYYPSRFNRYYERSGHGDRQSWVWVDSPESIRNQWGSGDEHNVYEVEPMDEGPWPFNGGDVMGYVTPRVRVKRRIRQKTAPPPKWQHPEDIVPRLVGPQPPDPNEQMDKAAMVLGMCTIDQLVDIVKETSWHVQR